MLAELLDADLALGVASRPPRRADRDDSGNRQCIKDRNRNEAFAVEVFIGVAGNNREIDVAALEPKKQASSTNSKGG